VRSGHKLNRSLLEALFADDEAWCPCKISNNFPPAGEVDAPPQIKEPTLAATA